MPISKEFRKMIETEFGREIKYSADCEALKQAIEDKTHIVIGLNTLRRMFGLINETAIPRGTTMDIIARYLGYKDKKEMERLLGDASDISMFSDVEELDIEHLAEGTMVQIAYDPKRLIIMTYMGDFHFIINESQNSKLIQGDKIRVTQLAKGFELYATEVIRNGEDLGQYHAAKDGGLTLIETFS